VMVAAAAAALFALAPSAVAPAQQFGIYTVTTTKDGNDGECAKDCTLREAVNLATGSGNSVTVPAGVYRLTQGPLVVHNNSVLFGGGFAGSSSGGARGTVIDARGASRAIQVDPNASAIVAGFTITGGRAATGAGVLVGSGSTLSLYNSIVDGNVATTRGGGIAAADGTVSLFGSTVSNNRVTGGNGGGVALDLDSNLIADISTISGNSASGAGGGVASAGNVTSFNATVAHNSAPSGAAMFIEPGGSGGANSIVNTILAGGPGGGTTCGGGLTGFHASWSGNLADDASCAFAPGEGTPNTDPRLGKLQNNRGATDTMALLSGSPAINAGDPNRCVGTDQRGAQAVGTCDVGAFEFGGVVPEAQVGQPVAGKSIIGSLSKGKVLVKLPGTNKSFLLQDGQQLPMGTTFDTTRGRVNIRADQGHGVVNKKMWIYDGVFKLTQTKGKKPLTTLTLTGKLQCGGGGKAHSALKKKRKRRLWGNGKGHFRTKGRNSAATVLGTKWYVEDTCKGTKVVVRRGKVRVTQFRPKKTIIVKAGHSYFAKRR
jgi:CSLREA domain-containing protein